MFLHFLHFTICPSKNQKKKLFNCYLSQLSHIQASPHPVFLRGEVPSFFFSVC